MNKSLMDSIGRNRKLCSLSDHAFRLWTCAVGACDGFGLMRADPWEFRTDAAPGLGIDDAGALAALDEMEEKKLIHRYAVDGHTYLVMHDHFDHNPQLLNLLNMRTKCPEPIAASPPIKCACIVKWQNAKAEIQRRTEERAERKRTSDANGTADIPPALKGFLTPIIKSKRVKP